MDKPIHINATEEFKNDNNKMEALGKMCELAYNMETNKSIKKVFEFKWNTEKDWVFGYDINAVKEFYLRATECVDLDRCVVTEVPEEEWEEMYMLDINEFDPYLEEGEEGFEDYNEDDYSCGYKIEMNFKDYVSKNSVMDIICTTEF